jgi:hypothetical protein
VKNIRLIVSSLAAVTAVTATAFTATGGAAQAASAQAASAQTRSAHSAHSAHNVNWGNVTIPGQLCKVNGPIKLHSGRAFVRHSGFGMALDVLTTTVTRGNLGRGLPVTALQVWCDNTGGTADGQLAEGIMVFDSPGGHPHLLGTLTPKLKGNPMVHIPFIAVNHIETTGHVAVTEFFYTPANATCCPSGRATTVWKWTGRTFVPGRTHITSK